MLVLPILLGLYLANTGKNSFVNREIAMHAKALDEIHLQKPPGMAHDIQKTFHALQLV